MSRVDPSAGRGRPLTGVCTPIPTCVAGLVAADHDTMDVGLAYSGKLIAGFVEQQRFRYPFAESVGVPMRRGTCDAHADVVAVTVRVWSTL